MKALLLTFALAQVSLYSQPYGIDQKDFPASEFRERRAKVFERIGRNAFALIQGAASAESPQVFRQSNEFYYLSGIEAPHAYLLLDGRSRKTTVYLPHRDPARERQIGSLVSAEDAAVIMERAGVEEVYGVEALAKHLSSAQIHLPAPTLYVPFSPSEGAFGSRDERLRQIGEMASDPWDGRPSRTGQLLALLRSRFPTYELRDLSPILDPIRLIKSQREITLIRRASEIAGLAIMEAIRGTKEGLFEYQLEAAARYVYMLNGAKHEGYPAIIGGGTNAWHGHYFRNSSRLNDGDLVLMDYAPDYRYYTSDVTRMWPVNGKYTNDQRALCGFILAYREALLKRIRPGITPDQVLDGARQEMEPIWKSLTFSKEIYRKAAFEALSFRGHLSHPVGMTVHDVGGYFKSPFAPGLVFSVDPMLWVPEEKLYVRMEDVVVVTETGVENFTDFLPSRPDDIEKLMREDGILQIRAPQAK
jgi:Xaa-Pro aminopeptidase